MNDFNYNSKLNIIEHYKNNFKKYKAIGDNALDELYQVFTQHNLNPNQIEENFVAFNFLGLEFIIKTEISIDAATTDFSEGQINTYFIDSDQEGNPKQLVLTYEFDLIGNFGRKYLLKEFAKNYYVDFINNLTAFSIKNNLKFQLK